MPAGPRIRANNVYGTISDNPMLINAVSFTSLGLSLLPAISSQHAVVVIDPKRTIPGGNPEIVVITSHLAMGTTATVLRGQYGTVAREWPQATPWAHVPIDEDHIEILTAGTRPSNPYEGQMIYETDTDKHMFYDGATWQQLGVVASASRMGWHVTRVANQSITASTTTAISWDTEVQDTPANFTAPSTTLTIPTAGDGLWAITCQANMGVPIDFEVTFVQIVAGGITFQNTDHDDVGNKVAQNMNISVIVPLVATNTIVCNFRHQAPAGAQNLTGRLTAYRIGT